MGSSSLFGRASDHDVVLVRPLQAMPKELNPGLPAAAYEAAIRQVVAAVASQSPAAPINPGLCGVTPSAQVGFAGVVSI